MKLTMLTYLILELNAALDSGKYDDISVSVVAREIEAKTVVPWIRGNIKEADLSLIDQADADTYHEHLAEIYGGYAGQERRKWGVQNRGLCLLIAWTNEIVQRAVRGKSLT